MYVSTCHLKHRQASLILDILLQMHAIRNKFSFVFEQKQENDGASSCLNHRKRRDSSFRLLPEAYRCAPLPGVFRFNRRDEHCSSAHPPSLFKWQFENTTIFLFFVSRFELRGSGRRGRRPLQSRLRLPDAYCLVKRTAFRWPSWQSGRAGASAGRRWPYS